MLARQQEGTRMKNAMKKGEDTHVYSPRSNNDNRCGTTPAHSNSTSSHDSNMGGFKGVATACRYGALRAACRSSAAFNALCSACALSCLFARAVWADFSHSAYTSQYSTTVHCGCAPSTAVSQHELLNRTCSAHCHSRHSAKARGQECTTTYTARADAASPCSPLQRAPAAAGPP